MTANYLLSIGSTYGNGVVTERAAGLAGVVGQYVADD